MRLLYSLVGCFLCTCSLFAQTELSNVINEYTAVLAIDDCNIEVSVDDPQGFTIGMEVIIIQMKGAQINESNSASFGNVEDRNGAGQYEVAAINSITNDKVLLAKPLSNDYQLDGHVQMVSFPKYNDAEVVSTILPEFWDGNTGGVVAFQVTNELTMSAFIDVRLSGFKGGTAIPISPNNCSWTFNVTDYFYNANNWRGSLKGEGIADYIINKGAGRGPQANGGGGGNDHNSGGGGGANVSAGGLGGENDEPSFFGCDGHFPGLGGKALPSDTTAIYLGGGGGAGHTNNTLQSTGANGAGIVILKANTIISNGIGIIADGRSAQLGMAQDGAGGGGAGGTVVLLAEEIVGSLIVNLNGGNGGSLSLGNNNRCMGPGGGGSGGRFLSNLINHLNLEVFDEGGEAGIVMNSSSSCNNTSMGAEPGQDGLQQQISALISNQAAAIEVIDSPADWMACVGDNVQFTADVSGDNLNYQWQSNILSGTWADLMETPPFQGTQTPNLQIGNVDASLNGAPFRLIISNDCGEEITTEQALLSVVAAPTIETQPTEVMTCEGQMTGFTIDADGDNLTYQWQVNDGTGFLNIMDNAFYTGSQTNDLMIANATANMDGYVFQCLVGNNCGTIASEAVVLSVEMMPQANFTFTTNGLSVDFSNQSAFANNGYQWNFGDTNSSTTSDPQHTFAQNGTYQVTLIASNDCGQDIFTQTITVESTELPQANFTSDFTMGCAPALIQFINNSSANASSYEWHFPEGNPSTSSLLNPLVSYTNPGLYSVSLIASNPAGTDTMTINDYLLIGASPTADFSFTSNGNVVSFTNNSTVGANYLWVFGDGTTSMDANPNHEYMMPGTYVVSLTVSNDCGTIDLSQVVEIIAAPNATINAEPVEGCAPLVVQYFGETNDVVDDWSWSFPGGTPNSSNEQNPQVVYPNSGTFPVSLVVGNAVGSNSVMINDYVVVNDLPSSMFTFDINGSVVDFTNNATNTTDYLWVFGDGETSNEANPNHEYLTPGTYVVSLTVSNECGSNELSQVVEIIAAPNASINASPVEGCAPLVVQYFGETNDLVETWSWSFPGGTPNSSSEQNPQITYPNSGTYNASLTVTNEVGSNVVLSTNPIQVDTLPSSLFSFVADGTTVTFSSLANNATSYVWDFGDGTMSTEPNPVHQFNAGGVYEVSLSTSNECGSGANITLTVEVEEQFVVAFDANFTEACAPFIFEFTDLSSPGTNTWNWSFPGGNPANSTAQNPTVVYTSPGSYTVSLEAGNGIQSNTASVTDYLNLIEAPLADFTYTLDGNTVSFTNNSSNGDSFEWNFGDGTFSMEENPSHEFTPGIYTVSLAVSNGLCSSFISQTIDVNSTAVHELSNGFKLHVFPNPTQHLLNIQIDGNSNASAKAAIMSIDGKLLLSDVFVGSNDFKFEIGHLPSGIYLLQIDYLDQRIIERIVKY